MRRDALGNRSSVIAMWVSLLSNVLLTGIKLIVGIVFKSQVLIADGIHNAGDIIATATAYSSMRLSGKPPDEDHPYGHGKAEVLGAGVVAFILVLAALYMGYHAVLAFFHPPGEAHLIALAAAVVSLIVKQLLYIYTKRVSMTVNSKALLATAYDHLADVYASLAASIGIFLAWLGERIDIEWLGYGDPAAGVIVSVLVLRLGIEMARETVDVLMDKSLSPEKVEDIMEHLREVPEVRRIDRLRAREHGHYVLVDARVAVLGTLTIQEGHDIIRKIKRKVQDAHPEVDEVLVHLNPWYADE
ncbi:cation diffusion facilitator family transporter [Paenibacillus glycinis]|uniref:Cation diffusion facilitator family transporter n=1 Tax=Paenibacillus glycinis TaxID=2697035 RepID=A0ABW9XUG5_9BACL|nr:cation diffusion facilitator family transporter [Paenibacillus glycinis]NBD26315.1 cation diffusion facilitator family transporter [Paenibacillus glycinis]